MALITRSKYGLIAVNNDAIKNIISKCYLEMEDIIIPCSKRGRVYKKGLLGRDPSVLNSIEITEEKGDITIDVYYVLKFGESISETANKLFDIIEICLDIIKIDKPKQMNAHIKGIMSKNIVQRDIVIERIRED